MSGEEIFVDILLKLGYYLVPATFILMFLAMVLGIVRNPKGSLKFIIGLAVLIVIFIVSYNGASGTPPPNLQVDAAPTAHTVKLVSAGITTFIASMIIAVVSLIGTSVVGLFR